jgi:hypothetical protein
MKTIVRAAGSALVFAWLCSLAGCGMSPKAEAPAATPAPAGAPPSPVTNETSKEDSEGEPTTLADAEALLEKARADLDRVALNTPPPAMAAGAAAPPPASIPAPSPARAERRADKASSASAADEAGAVAPAAQQPNGCETACKAYSSLTRASDAVCRLDAEGGKRCQRARQIREDASQRVASCGCAP